MKINGSRAQTARSLRTSFVILFGITFLVWFAVTAMTPLPARWGVAAVQAGVGLGGLWVLLRVLRPQRYRAAHYFAFAGGLLAGVVALSLCLPAVWLGQSAGVAAALWALMLALLWLGYRVGLARLDAPAQAKALRAAVKADGNRWRLKGQDAEITGHIRRFAAGPERLFQALLWLFGAVVLALAVLGGAGGLVLVRALAGLGVTENTHAVAFVALSLPALAACGYAASALVPASRAWAALLDGQAELWPEDT